MEVQQTGTKERRTWPVKVRCGSVVVPVYRRKVAGGWGYLVANYSEGRRRLDSYKDPEEALAVADKIARGLAKGDVTATQLRSSDAAAYGRALELLRPTGIGLEVACAAIAEAWKVAPGLETILAACRDHAKRAKVVVPTRVEAVVDELLKVKASRGASERYLGDLRSRLGQFKADFRCNIGDVRTADLQAWLDAKKPAPQTYRNFARVLSLCFDFAIGRGYASENPASGLDKVDVRAGDIEVFTPAEMVRLLAAAEADFLPVLALGAFAGIRSAELMRLEWSDIDQTAGHVIVSASNSKTASRRIIPILPALSAFLAPYSKSKGPVWPLGEDALPKRMQATAEKAEVTWKANGLRHSFATYRYAETQNAGTTAAELGHSSAILMRHYRELATKEQAAQWFAIRPPAAPANVVQLSQVSGGSK